MNPKVKDTSLEAYKELRNSGKLNKQQEEVMKFFITNPNTDYNYHEVQAYSHVHTAQKRLSELEGKGLIKKAGVRNGCATYQYVADLKEQTRLRQLHATKKPEMERFAAWMHNQRLKQHGKNWYGKIGDSYGEFTHAQLIKQFRQSEKLTNQIIW